MNCEAVRNSMSAAKLQNSKPWVALLLLLIVHQLELVCTDEDEMDITGDIILGGLFPIHRKSLKRENECGLFNPMPGYHYMEAMLYAIDGVNANPNILPNITLGAKIYDTCMSKTIAAYHAKRFISMSLSKSHKHQLAGVIGGLNSDVSETVANFLRVFEIPQISYSSTSVVLSNKDVYSYFLRTVPPDSFQTQAIVDIILKFGWSYVSTVNSAGIYGAKGIEVFWKLAEENDICIDVKAKLSFFPTQREYDSVIKRLHNGKEESRVVVVFATHSYVRQLLEAAKRWKQSNNYRGFTWIGSDGWSSRDHATETVEEVALGALTIMMRSGEISQGFKDYFAKLTLENYPRKNKRFFTEFWESHFLCSVPEGSNQTSQQEKYNATCRGCESLQDGPVKIDSIRDTVNAVIVFAHALDSLQKELCPNQVGKCPAMTPFKRPRLLEHLKNVSFLDPSVNATVAFDQNNEVSGMYDIMNFRMENGKPRYVRVGTWDGEYVGDKIVSKLVFDKEIKWSKGTSDVPESTCSKKCSFDNIRAPIPSLDFKCCWKCQQCGNLQIVLNNTCQSGPIGWKPNSKKTGWVKRSLVYPKWNDYPSIFLIVISLFSLVLTLLTVLVYIVYTNNRLLKASGRELCFVMLTGIALCFTVPFLFLAKPKDELCYARGLVIGLALAMCYAPLFMKINRIYRIFTGAKSSVAPPAFATPRMQLLITFGLIGIQLMFTAFWFIAKPVRATETYIPSREELLLECKFDGLSFSVNLCYVMVLMCLCTAYAFKTRNFPKNFNESKYIGISMYITCAVWMMFFPFYLNTDDSVRHTYLISIACVIIGLVTLLGIFAQKVYIVFCVKNIRNGDLVFSFHGHYQRKRIVSTESEM